MRQIKNFSKVTLAIATLFLPLLMLSSGCTKEQGGNVVEVYDGVLAGGQLTGLKHVTNINEPYTESHHFMTVDIAGGLAPGDKVFVAGELRLNREGSPQSIVINAQSAICLIDQLTTLPDPGKAQPNVKYICPHLNDNWDLTTFAFPIDRSGVYTHEGDRLSSAYVTFYARPNSGNSSLNNTFAVGGWTISLSVIVVRA